MKFLTRAFLFLSVALILLISSACSQDSGPPEIETLQNLGFRVIPEGNNFPDISFTDSDNQIHRLSDFKGTVVLLNFWASWCPPCRAEMPAMEKLAEKLSGSDFTMLPINVQEPRALVESFVEEFEIGFPVYFDEDAETAKAVGVTGLPTSILIDRDGTAIAVVTGAIEWDSEELVSMMTGWTD